MIEKIEFSYLDYKRNLSKARVGTSHSRATVVGESLNFSQQPPKISAPAIEFADESKAIL